MLTQEQHEADEGERVEREVEDVRQRRIRGGLELRVQRRPDELGGHPRRERRSPHRPGSAPTRDQDRAQQAGERRQRDGAVVDPVGEEVVEPIATDT